MLLKYVLKYAFFYMLFICQLTLHLKCRFYLQVRQSFSRFEDNNFTLGRSRGLQNRSSYENKELLNVYSCISVQFALHLKFPLFEIVCFLNTFMKYAFEIWLQICFLLYAFPLTDCSPSEMSFSSVVSSVSRSVRG